MIQRTLVLGLLALASFGNAATLKRVTYPSPSPDGKSLVFSWQGDLWTSSISGGDARRITVHPASDTFSKWMPDGSRIVFASDRMGSVDLFSIKHDGTDLKRITFDSFTETPYAISADGAWIYGYTNAWGSSNCFKVSSSGGDIVRLTGHPLEAQYCPSPSASGLMVAYNNGGRVSNWRQAEYKGTNSGEIWIANNSVPFSAAKNLTKNEFADIFPMMSPDNSIFFVSNRSGWPNLWRMNSDGSGAKKLTNFSFGTVRYPTMNAGGTVISFEFDSEIYTYNTKSGAVTKLEFDVPADSRVSPTLDLTLTTGASDLAVSPDGKRSAIEVRGDIYLIPEKGGTTRRLTSSMARDSDPIWIGPKTLLFVTGRNHKREFWTVDIQGVEKPFYQHPTLDAVNPRLSPDGKTVAFNLGDQEIGSVPVAGGAMKTLVKSPALWILQSGPNFDWSPDSKWIVFDVPKERGSTIDALNLETGRRVMVATTARGGTNPKWLPNGKGIFFTADGDLGEDLFMVDLVPADPTFTEDDLDKIDEKPEKKDDKPVVEIDEHFLFERTR
ncbi:MAG: hypothetical protein K8R88_07050, partial [Armatimonadetes bacterium]|nr:hypothetical protein [Armatimonadota bacterium]